MAGSPLPKSGEHPPRHLLPQTLHRPVGHIAASFSIDIITPFRLLLGSVGTPKKGPHSDSITKCEFLQVEGHRDAVWSRKICSGWRPRHPPKAVAALILCRSVRQTATERERMSLSRTENRLAGAKRSQVPDLPPLQHASGKKDHPSPRSSACIELAT